MALNRAYQADESNQFDRYNEFSANQFSEEMDSNFSAGKLPVKQDARHHKKGRRPVLLSYLLEFWRSWVVLLAPLLLLPLPLATPDNVRQEMLVAYTILWMAAYWMTEALPLPITSMLPMVLLPLLGVQRTTEVAINYLNATNFMFVGGLMMAVAVEHCGLHQRIALNIISIVGTSQRKLMLGFMLTTMFLSMWISNTATVAMVVPIVDSVSAAIATSDAIDMEDTGTNNKKTHKAKDAKKGDEKTRNILLLACAYAANIGGTGVITGSPPNLVVLKQFAKVNTPLTFASWMGFAIPLMLVNVLIAWCWLQFLQWLATRGDLPPTEEQNQRVKRTIAEKKKNLGRISLHEIQVLLLFILLVCLWFFRKPKFIDGWGALFEQKDSSPGYVHSATPAILVIVLVYILPTKYNFWPFIKRGETPSSSPALLDWHTVEKNLPWGVIILLGGGFALAGASKSSGLSDLIGSGLEPLQDLLPPWAINVVICLMTAMVTEIASNTATANILVPILGGMSITMCQNPIYLMLSTAITCSYAFMLPVATAPNAIVFGASTMGTGDMMKAGIFMNFVCVLTTSVAINTYGSLMFGLDEFPSWAHEYGNDNTTMERCVTNLTALTSPIV